MIKKILTLIILLIILALLLVMKPSIKQIPSPIDEIPDEDGTFACTMDAMMCPDGSYVGRTGPLCEFVCPTVASSTSATLKMNETYTMYGVSIQPQEIVSESRCPSDVTCIQAGTVKVAVLITTESGSHRVEFEPGQKENIDSTSLTLKEVTPYPQSTHKTTDDEYRFVFEMGR